MCAQCGCEVPKDTREEDAKRDGVGGAFVFKSVDSVEEPDSGAASDAA